MDEPKEFRRITVEEAEAAYAATGLVPKAGIDLHRGCGCPIMACAIHAGMVFPWVRDSLWRGVKHLGLTIPYANGFILGFDAKDRSANARPHTESGLGYADGKAVRDALLISKENA